MRSTKTQLPKYEEKKTIFNDNNKRPIKFHATICQNIRQNIKVNWP